MLTGSEFIRQQRGGLITIGSDNDNKYRIETHRYPLQLRSTVVLDMTDKCRSGL